MYDAHIGAGLFAVCQFVESGREQRGSGRLCQGVHYQTIDSSLMMMMKFLNFIFYNENVFVSQRRVRNIKQKRTFSYVDDVQ